MKFNGGDYLKKKAIISLRVARFLISQGIPLLDMEKSKKYNGQMVFIFEDNKVLRDVMQQLPPRQ